jgi:hypothetical protein
MEELLDRHGGRKHLRWDGGPYHSDELLNVGMEAGMPHGDCMAAS